MSLLNRWFLPALALCVCAALPVRAANEAVRWPEKRATPDFSLQDSSGKEWKLSAVRGKVVIVNFWATWCEPC